MSFISEADESLSKHMRFEDDCKTKSSKKEDKRNIQKDTKDTSNSRGSLVEETQQQKDDKLLVHSDDERSMSIDSDDESFIFPPDEDISDMLDEVQYSGYFPTITDRYFTAYYKINTLSPGDDICIYIHSNRICMLSLAPSHVILESGRDISKVDFKVSDKLDRTLNKVSGKGKHGAQPLQTNSNICTISCSDGQTYLIKCSMIGKLVEVNEMLSEKPQLLREPLHKGGYLAIILPNIKLLEKLKQSLLTHEQYIELIEKRKQQCGTNDSVVTSEAQNLQ